MRSKIVALSKNEEFKTLLKKKKISNKYVTIFFGILDNKNNNKLNISFVAKKKIGNAVKRNKIKRRLRNIMNDAIRKISIKLQYSYLVIAKPTVLNNEFNNAKLHIFNIADTDKSGVISPFELEDWRKTALGSLDAPPGNLSFDKDYDQRITKNEFNKTLISIFESGDKNNDGILKFSELVNVFEISNRMVTTTDNESNNWK